jgi:hypothetical protein
MEPSSSFILLIVSLVLSFGVAHALFGMAWYSEGAFGPLWRKCSGKTAVAHTSKKKMILTHVGASAIAAVHAMGLVFASFFIASFVMPATWSPTAALYGAVASLWFFVALLPAVVENIYQRNSWKMFVIDKGFGFVFAMAAAALAIVIPSLFQ